jgi:serine/threonine protein kinase
MSATAQSSACWHSAVVTFYDKNKKMNEFIGRKIDHYRIDALLGEGGMGVVYRAYDLNLARTVALKVMHPHLARQQEFKARFLQEAQSAARLSHPSVVTVHHFGTSQDLLYMVMAYITGGSLNAHLQQLHRKGEVVQLQEILFFLAQVADALGYAHRQGVVHRDVKPSNVMVQRLEEPEREGEPPLRAVVTDFGLAKLLTGGVQTRSDILIGTYPYMSPEQCLGETIDGRSDIYSLGVMLYQLTTGKLPLDIQSATDAVLKHQRKEAPPAPREVWPGLPGIVEAIIQKALAHRPEDRFQKAEMMSLALREAITRLTEADVTRFAQQRAAISLVTELKPEAPAAEPSRMGFDLSPATRGDRLVIAQKDHTPHAIPMDKAELTLGRADECDVLLSNQDVSRQHTRIERTASGWQVVDLGSTNGTFLEDTKLLPAVPVVFSAGQTLRIGPYFIHWQKAGQPVSTILQSYQSTASKAPTSGMTRIRTNSGQIEVRVNPTNLEVAPGGRADLQVELFNQGVTVDHFNLLFEGLPPSWVSIPPGAVELMPGAEASLPCTIHPPQDSSVRAGQHPYRLVVSSTSNPQETARIPGQVIVKPLEQFSIDIQPSNLTSGGTSRVTIHNLGNAEAVYNVVGNDPAEAIQFEGERGRIKVGPGQTETLALKIMAKNRPILGTNKSLPFEVQVGPGTGSPQKRAGQLVVRPWIPGWILPPLGLLLVFCLAGVGFLFNRQIQSNAQATQTSDAGNAIALSIGETAQADATAVALTAIAEGDNDSDGLSNQQERDLGTDPEKADTDEDGLSDGQEVNQYGTDPKNRDTDADNLLDGDEANEIGTNPRIPDTDGDGIRDDLDQAPIATSTLTPLSSPSPTNTSAPTSTFTSMPPTLTFTPLPPTSTMVPVPILSCPGTGTGGDLANLRGVRFTVSNSFSKVQIRLAGRSPGLFTINAELRRATGFSGPADFVSNNLNANLPGSSAGIPYQSVEIDFGHIPVTGAETFTLKINVVSGSSDLFLETFGIGTTPCPNVEETDENNVDNPTERGDPAGFQVLGFP